MKSRSMFLAAAVVPVIGLGLGQLIWATYLSATSSVSVSSFILPLEPQVRSSWQAPRCTRIAEDTTYRLLPKDGILYRLGNIAGENRSDTNQFLVISGVSDASWDMLWSDFSGAFDQRKAPNVTLFIPWRNPHTPLFLVSYSNEPVEVDIVHAVKTLEPMSLPDFSGSCSQHLKAAIHAIGDIRDSLRRVQSVRQGDVPVEVVNAEEVFRYPIRKPFYRRRESQSGIVTVCTQLTVDRLQRLEGMAKSFAGPISAVIYIGFRGSSSEELAQLDQFYASSYPLRKYADVHLVFHGEKPWYATGKSGSRGLNPYPVNLLRQYAVEQATTDWVLYLEGDMATVQGGHDIIAETWDGMMQLHKQSEERAVFVVPIYVYNGTYSTGLIQRCPSNKAELMRGVPGVFKRISYPSHRALNYDEWESLADETYIPYHKSGDSKAILHYHQEPYFIIRKGDMPPYDVLFAGMEQDKETQVRDTNACGFRFFVHARLFAVDFPQKSKEAGWTSWTNPKWKRQHTWRQAFVHSMHEAYKQELYKAMITSGRGAFQCGSDGLREISARGYWAVGSSIKKYKEEINTRLPKPPKR